MGIEGYYEDYFDDREEPKKLTNFQKIKSMSLDEMAEWMQYFNLESLCHFCLGCDYEDEEIGCIEGVKQWLQEESEE